MAPEQLRGEDPDPSWDLWALAVIAFEMLCGSHPFASMPLADAIRAGTSRRSTRDWPTCPRAASSSLPARWHSIEQRGTNRRRSSWRSSRACMPEGGFRPPKGAGLFRHHALEPGRAAGRKADARSAEALASVCEMYWFPVYAFIRRQGCGPDEGADLHTGVLRPGDREGLPERRRSRERALPLRFSAPRSGIFSRTSRRSRPTLKRGGHHPTVSLDVETADGMIAARTTRRPHAGQAVRPPMGARAASSVVLANVRDQQVSAGKGELFDRSERDF